MTFFAYNNQNKILYDRENVKIAIEKKGSNKEINTLLSIKFDSLKFEEENGVRVSVFLYQQPSLHLTE